VIPTKEKVASREKIREWKTGFKHVGREREGDGKPLNQMIAEENLSSIIHRMKNNTVFKRIEVKTGLMIEKEE
jgi:hypothetical protein